MTRYDLPTRWTLTASTSHGVPSELQGALIEATVPGCVHTDLLGQSLIPDPYVGTNEKSLHWIGEQGWCYQTTFEVNAELLAQDHFELVCEGLDTIATLELNGVELGKSETMHVAYRFNLRSSLREGENSLKVTFHALLVYAHAQRDRLGYLPTSEYPHPYNFIRKMACNFGWDWGPTLVTAGIWQPIYLEVWHVARISSVRPLVLKALAERASLDVYVDCVGDLDGIGLHASLTDPRGKVIATRHALARNAPLHFEIAQPQLWWPRGHGEQPLYTLSVELKKGDTTLSTVTKRLGLRQVRLDTSTDEIGSRFTLEVNGKAIFCKGANWIPDDCFPSRITPERYRERITQAAEANMNMLRVWGGGIYEQDIFYDLCDEQGVMVWQDFLFACAAYPEEEPFASLVAAEARYQVTRLSSHPSLVLWNGCNKNFWGYFEWATNGKTWKQWTEGRTWGLGFYTELLPHIVKELDPSRPYSPGSPYSNSMMLHPLSDNHGTKHMWDTWNQADYTVYRNYLQRFASEFGHQEPATYATLASAIPREHLSPTSDTMLHHQKANDGQGKLHRRLEEHFMMPASFEAWLYATQLNQARALTTGIEWFRAHAPRCMGTLYWQLNDCWPVISWSAIDSQERKKPLWYATRSFYADRLLTFQPEGADLFLYIINDSDEPWQDTAQLHRRDFLGDTLEMQQMPFSVAARSVTRLLLNKPLVTPQTKDSELLQARVNDLQALWFVEVDKYLHYLPAMFDLDLEPSKNGYTLIVTAQSLLRDLCVLVDMLDVDAQINHQLVTLFPSETFVFEIMTQKILSTELFLQPHIIQAASSLQPERRV
jgi:beta-mannosidase